MDPHRKKFGLKTFAELRAAGGGEKENLLIQQKTETVDALSKIAQPCIGVPQVRPCFFRSRRAAGRCGAVRPTQTLLLGYLAGLSLI